MFVSKSVGGNVHEAVAWVNTLKCAGFVHSFVPIDGGQSCIVIFRIPSREDREEVRRELGLRLEDSK